MKGFSVIELLLVLALGASLMGYVTMNLVRTQHATSLSTTADMFIADMKSQQTRSMEGTTQGGASGSYGVFIDSTKPNQYTLFRGDPNSDPAKFVITLDTPLSISSSPTTPITFSQVSGETSGIYTITLKNNAGGETEIITVNKYGVVTGIN